MAVGIGFTAEEIREFVHDYEVQPFGTKLAWLAGSGVSYERLRNWRSAVFEGDLERGLVPRKGMPMTIHQGGRRSLERQRARERAEQEAEVTRLNGRVEELEGINAALGKAIGLLHRMSEQEPDSSQTPSDPPDC